MGFNTYYWGPRLWEVLHVISFDYPIKPTLKEKEDMKNFLLGLRNVLPCIYCRKNYARNINEMPIKLNCRKDLVLWLIDLHNEVNGKEGKRHYTYEEVLKEYEKKLGKQILLTGNDNSILKLGKTCDKHCWNMVNISIIIIIVILVLFFIQKKYNIL